jgi:cytochrome c-type biogenesis protein CcmH
MTTTYHCEAPHRRRRDPDPTRPFGARLLRFARNDIALLMPLILVWLVLGAHPALAVRPDEMLANPALEARAEHIGRELRCLVCRNQSIEDSEADLAHDLRLLVRRRLAAGDSDAEVVAYIRSRYGDYVLLRPPLEFSTLLLWGGPLLVLLAGAAAVALFYRRRDRRDAAPLDSDEERRLAAALGEAVER